MLSSRIVDRQPPIPLLALGFRPFYCAGALFAVVGIALWLAAFAGLAPFDGYLRGVYWHSHEMVFGFAVAVLAGFLLTAVRNWTGLPTPTGAALAGMALLWLSARILLVTGPVSLAVVVDVAFLPVLMISVGLPVLHSRNRRNYKVIGIVAVVALAHAAFHLALLDRLPPWLARVLMLATLDVIAILLALIGGRVIPAFTRNAVPGSDPRHRPWLEFAAFASLGLVAVAGVVQGLVPFPDSVTASLLVVAAASHGYRLALWQPQRTIANPLLWMLPTAYAWLPLALCLRALGSFGIIAPGVWVHALSAGAISALMVAMMMRSTLGHTGRPLVATRVDMTVFVLVQLAATLRVTAPWLGSYRTMILVSGGAWLLAFTVFLLRYVPMLARPRVDGKPG